MANRPSPSPSAFPIASSFMGRLLSRPTLGCGSDGLVVVRAGLMPSLRPACRKTTFPLLHPHFPCRITPSSSLYQKRPFPRRGAFPSKTPPKPPEVRFNTRLETRVRELDRRDEFRDTAGTGTSH